MDSVPSLGGLLDSLYRWVRRVTPHPIDRHMTFAAHSIIVRSLTLSGPGSFSPPAGESGGGANQIAVANTVTISETVGGTHIVAMNDNDNLLFVDFNSGRIRRILLSGAELTQLGTSSIAYNGESGGLLSLTLGADGFVYVSNTNAIFKLVSQ